VIGFFNKPKNHRQAKLAGDTANLRNQTLPLVSVYPVRVPFMPVECLVTVPNVLRMENEAVTQLIGKGSSDFLEALFQRAMVLIRIEEDAANSYAFSLAEMPASST
jgi:hypothetical protein